MGLLFTTPGTRAILDTLNTAFNGPKKGEGLDFIRNKMGAKIRSKVEKRNWNPGHLARMLQLLPFDQGGGGAGDFAKNSKRWWWFLKKTIGGPAIFKPLRNALADAILDTDTKGNKLNIVRVTFDHVELESSDKGRDPNPNIVIYDAPLPGDSGGKVRHITLFTAALKPSDEDTPPGLGSDEEYIPVKPPWDKS